MRLAPNWKDILKKAWSVRFLIVAAIFGGIEAMLPFLEGIIPVSPGVFGLLSFFATIAALVSRHVYQENLPDG